MPVWELVLLYRAQGNLLPKLWEMASAIRLMKQSHTLQMQVEILQKIKEIAQIIEQYEKTHGSVSPDWPVDLPSKMDFWHAAIVCVGQCDTEIRVIKDMARQEIKALTSRQEQERTRQEQSAALPWWKKLFK